MEQRSQLKKSLLNNQQETKLPEKHSETSTEVSDPILETLDGLYRSLDAGRKILDSADAILVYYVALVNSDGVVSCVKGTTHLSELLKDSRLSEAATTVDTMLTVAVTQPMVGKIQSHMEESAKELERFYENVEPAAKRKGPSKVDTMLSGTAPHEAEMVVDPDQIEDQGGYDGS